MPRLRCGGGMQFEKADLVKLTLPTVPMALTYVQLLARGSLSQCCSYNGERRLLEGQCVPQMDTCSGGKTLETRY